MSILYDEITQEKMRPQTEMGYIQRLQQMQDKTRGELDFFHFCQTGRIYSRLAYQKKFDTTDYHPDTRHVLVYVTGQQIDIVGTTGMQYHAKVNDESVFSKSAKELERKLFEEYKNKS